jgi:hypothetical protein
MRNLKVDQTVFLTAENRLEERPLVHPFLDPCSVPACFSEKLLTY